MALECLINLQTSSYAKKLVLSISEKLFAEKRQGADRLMIPFPPNLFLPKIDSWDLLTARYYLFFHSIKNNDSELEKAIINLKSDLRGILNPNAGHLSEPKAQLISSIIQIDSRLHHDSQSKFIKLAFLRLDKWIQELALSSNKCGIREVSQIVQILLQSFSLNKVNEQKHFFKIYKRVWLKVMILRKLRSRPRMFQLCLYYSAVQVILESILVKQIIQFDQTTIVGILVSLSKDFIRNFSHNVHEFFSSLDELIQILKGSPTQEVLETLILLDLEDSKAFLVDIFRALLDSANPFFRSLCSRVLFDQFQQRYFLGNIMNKFSLLKSSSSRLISNSVLTDFYLCLLEVVFHLNLYQKQDLPGFFTSVLKNLGSLTLGTGQTSFVRLLLHHSNSDPQLLVIFFNSIIEFLKSLNEPHLNFDSQIHLLLDLLNQ